MSEADPDSSSDASSDGSPDAAAAPAEALRVFVNGRGVSVPMGSTVLDAVRAFDAEAATAVGAGTRAVADSRGISVPPETELSGGYVMRIVSARALREDAP